MSPADLRSSDDRLSPTKRFARPPWYAERLHLVEDRTRARLDQLSVRDLMMVSVLLRLRPSGILDRFPNLSAYVARGEARPAYKRAFAAQLAINNGKPSTV